MQYVQQTNSHNLKFLDELIDSLSDKAEPSESSLPTHEDHDPDSGIEDQG